MATKSDPAVPQLVQTIKRKASPISTSLVEGLVQDDFGSIARSNLPGPRRDAVPTPPPKDYSHGDSNIPSRLMSARSVGTDYERAPETTRAETAPPLPVRPKRADSGAAIDFDNVGVYGKPRSFKEIMAMQNYEDRMEMYEKTREYWANAEHGLADWTGKSGGPRTVQLRREDRWR
ncbi:hypothetical protein E8E13_010746 [Curvularia kusanoi]|uniref:Uncharacterized protein n=1 Tax=Curvularia kusanoi TaxID=90978 RepID=A0A9P4TP15_CURKU|nr:hypothetical protein E8E13_010746 [Curvularia kusanoi]